MYWCRWRSGKKMKNFKRGKKTYIYIYNGVIGVAPIFIIILEASKYILRNDDITKILYLHKPLGNFIILTNK
jgi:hypothetical protein